jgi:Chromo (CHRromatin Organisation MOdifier) domain
MEISWITRFGMISDWGPQFAAELMKELNKLLGIQTKLSTAYHLQTDRQTEWINQEIEQYLRLFVLHCQDDWVEWITIAEFSYNNKIHSSTKVSPFYANYGYHPRMGMELHHYTKVEAADEFASWMKQIHKEAWATMTKAQEEMKHYMDYHCGQPPKYEVGQKVWLETENLNMKRLSKKLTEKCIGPYPNINIKSSNAVQLKLPWSIKIKICPIINISHICPYWQPCIPQQTAPEPPSIEIEGEFEYEVEWILDSWLYWGNLQYLVKWLGYTKEHNTWELVSKLTIAQEAINNFHYAHPSTPCHIQSLSPFQFWPIKNYMETPKGFKSALNCNGVWIISNKYHHERLLHQCNHSCHIPHHPYDILNCIHTKNMVAHIWINGMIQTFHDDMNTKEGVVSWESFPIIKNFIPYLILSIIHHIDASCPQPGYNVQ